MPKSGWLRIANLAIVLGLWTGSPWASTHAQDAPKSDTESKPSDEAKTTDNAKTTESDEAKTSKTNKVVVFRLSGPITETPSEDISLFSGTTGVSLRDLVAADGQGGEGRRGQGRRPAARGGHDRQGADRGAASGDGPAEEGRQAGLRPCRRALDGLITCSFRGHAAERRADGRPLGHRLLRRGALPPRAARQARRPARLPDLRRLQERRPRSSCGRSPAPRPRRCRTGCSTASTRRA